MNLQAPVAIEVAGLRKAFGDQVVLNGVDLRVAEATIFALLGPNGAGKTTMVQILSTLIRADAGEIRVAGHGVASEPDAVRAAIGVTGQFSAVDKLLTGAENLMLMADLCHLGREQARERVTQLLELFGLAMTLVGRPQIIFLDEPTTGLDPRSRRTMWQIIRNLAADGVTIFLTTQYLEEADRLADQIALLDRGTIVAEGTPGELKRLVPGGHVVLRLADASALTAARAAAGTGSADEEALTLTIPGDGSVRSLRLLLGRLDEARVDVAGLMVRTPDLDDVFLTLTG